MKAVRDLALFLVGVAGVVNEGWIRQGEARFHLLIVYMAMIGLPAFDPGEIAKAVGNVVRRNGNGHAKDEKGTEKPPGPVAFSRVRWRYA